MFYIRSLLFPLLGIFFTLPIIFYGCESKQQTMDRASLTILQEKVVYEKLLELSSSRGEDPSRQLKNWSLVLKTLSDMLEEIRFKTEPSPKGENFFKQELDLFLPGIEDILSRSLNISIQSPQWMYLNAKDDLDKIKVSLSNIKKLSSILYAKDFSDPLQKLNILISEDAEVYDTQADCVIRFEILSNELNDPACEQISKRSCGHQMDFKCLENLITEKRSGGCLGTPWIEQITDLCTSSSVVLKR